MKLVTFLHASGNRVGLLSADGRNVVDLSGLAPDMTSLIAQYSELKPRIAAMAAESSRLMPLSDVKLLAPIPRPPRNIYCVGKNYREHAKEFAGSGFDSSTAKGADGIPEAPIIFTKPPSSVIGTGEAIVLARDPHGSVDYEAELAVVIGKRGTVGPNDDPWSFVFGFTLVNDVTSRELQKLHKQWVLGKGIDGFCPMGPAIVTLDEIPDITKLVIKGYVNGELRQSAPLSDLIFDIPTLIRSIGRAITLEPGDVIATGTPAGVGIGFTPPRYLKAGDVVRVEMDSIGTLENTAV